MPADLSARLAAALTRQGIDLPDGTVGVDEAGERFVRAGGLWYTHDGPDCWPVHDSGGIWPDLSAWPTVGVLLGLLAGEREVAVFGPPAPCVVDIWRVAWTAPDGWPHAFDEEAPSELGRIGDALAAALLAAWGEP